MMDMDAFFQVHKGLEREGPGTAADVHWVLSQIPAPSRVLDAGCGPGADLVTFAEALPGAEILGLDIHFADEAAARVDAFGDRVQAGAGDMANPPGQFDLIWCVGALYFLGVTEGLTGWRSALASGGHVAFSEPVLLDATDKAAMAFWEDYPALTDADGIVSRIQAAGYAPLSHRLITGAPWAIYYQSMQARLDMLRASDLTPALELVVAEHQREIDLWREGQSAIAYMLYLCAPLEP